jgi:hypothetical protein
MLAAPYLLPALALQPAVAIATMTAAPALQASHWTILSADPAIRDGLFLIGLMAAAAALPALLLLRRDRWCLYLLAILALALGIVPALWRLPLLSQVQFPWRLLVLADFGFALIVARSAWPSARLLVVAAPALALSLIILSLPTSNNAAPPLGLLRTAHADVIEYLPAGVSEPYAAYSHRALALAAAMPAARSSNGWTTLRLHYFPIWRIRCGATLVPSGPEPGTGLLRYRGRDCALEQKRPASELCGFALAILALLALGLGRRQLPSLFSFS